MGRLEESFDNAASALTFSPIYKGSTRTTFGFGLRSGLSFRMDDPDRDASHDHMRGTRR